MPLSFLPSLRPFTGCRWDFGDLKPEWSEYVELERPWFYKLPKQRYQWDAPGSLRDHLPHAWTDVFADLVFVGAAIQLGRLVVDSFAACSVEATADESACIGMWSGVLLATLYFQALFSLWALSKWFRSTLVTDSPLHAAADALYLLLLALTCSSIGTYPSSFPRLAALCFLYWTLRFIEGALLGDKEVRTTQASHLHISSLAPWCHSTPLLPCHAASCVALPFADAALLFASRNGAGGP